MLLATGKAQRFPIHAAIAAASPAETAADLAASPHGGTVMDVGARRVSLGRYATDEFTAKAV
jgi:hypothetical protein